MTKVRVYNLDDEDLPKKLHHLRDIFLRKSEEGRKPGEPLHDFLMRRNIACFCRKCRAEREQKAKENNATIV